MTLKISKSLSLTFPIDANSGAIQVHSMPISRGVFERYCTELALLFAEFFAGGDTTHLVLTAPQIAYPSLKRLSIERGTWDSKDGGLQAGLIREIVRLTTVATLTPDGWENAPLDTAIKRKIIDEDSEAEILSTLVFFTVVSWAAPKSWAPNLLERAGSLRDWAASSCTPSEWARGLPTSTETETLEIPTSSLIS